MPRGLLVVPPFIKYNAGPLLGPCLLQSAARNRGHSCSVLDLNAILIQQDRRVSFRRGLFVGDHDKPVAENGSMYLTQVEDKFFRENMMSTGIHLEGDQKKRIQYGFLDHASVKEAASYLARSSPFGMLAKAKMEEQYSGQSPPHVVGVSLLHAGQVMPAATISVLVQKLFPDALVVWGGPHVSGLGSALEKDIHQRSYAADVFVTGHAEQTFTEILDAVSSPDGMAQLKSNVSIVKGKQGCSPVSPVFDNLEWYDKPLTLPAQSGLGCAYGRCKFCTYPGIEPIPQKLPLDIAVGSVVRSALLVGAASIAIKDSLATPLRLRQIADCIAGQVQWSACTKLNTKIDAQFLQYLRDRGLATIEVGLESLLPETQKRIDKIQSQAIYEKFVQDVASVKGLYLVVNYMTGFPWEDPEASTRKMREARELMLDYLGDSGHLEHNSFELERLSPMMSDPPSFDISTDKLKEWPWASVVEFK
ncbi:hypothetical protein ACA910_017191 [Epithemia clementina (nom. ined.)]